MVGDLGIEPSVRLRQGVTVPCHTLRPVAHQMVCLKAPSCSVNTFMATDFAFRLQSGNNLKTGVFVLPMQYAYNVNQLMHHFLWAMDMNMSAMRNRNGKRLHRNEKPDKSNAPQTVWLYGLHAVRDALENPIRKKLRLVVTANAARKLESAIAASGISPELADPRKFPAPIDPQSVHQGAALEAVPLNWGGIEERCMAAVSYPPRVLILDQVSDPHNVGAILRSAEVFGALAVIGHRYNSAPETGSLAKSASGALERQPYIRVRNIAETIKALQKMGYFVLGLDGKAEQTISQVLGGKLDKPVALVLGSEGSGLRQKTKIFCDTIARIDSQGNFGSLNVSNAAAVSLYALRKR